MRPVALLTRQWPQGAHQALNELCETRLLMPETDPVDEFFRTFNKDVAILCSSFLDPVEEALLDALPRLELIAHFGAWREPLEPIRARGLRLVDTGPAGAAEAADFALTQLLAVRRRLTEPLIESGAKRTLDQGLADSVKGMTIGLLGYDEVGGELARRCRALGMKVLCHAPDGTVPPVGVELVGSAITLAERCSALSLHGPQRTPLLTAETLAHCATGCIVVNLTDARLIDEAALTGALRDHRLAGAGLDVYHDEQRLADCPNTLLTPRLATNTLEARSAMAERLVSNILAYLREEPPHD